jgi:hypothetical protein
MGNANSIVRTKYRIALPAGGTPREKDELYRIVEVTNNPRRDFNDDPKNDGGARPARFRA